MRRFSRFCYRIISLVLRTTYRHVPVFGRLRGAIAVIRRDDGYIMIDRSDGLGVCFPGGLCGWKESPEQTVRREISEETGLEVLSVRPLFDYDDDCDVPCHTFVFEATANGAPHDSWEGSVRIITLEEAQRVLMPNHRPVIECLLRSNA